MAIKIIREWNSIIINVEKVNKKVVNGGLISILTDYYPPKKKSSFQKIKGLFSKPSPLTLSDFDNKFFASRGIVIGGNGTDGNLYFMSRSDKEKINCYIKDLESRGLVSNKKSQDCDFYIYDDTAETAHPCKWLHLLMKEEPVSSECIVSSYAYFSIYPFTMPIPLQGKSQGHISYYSQYAWEQYQKMVDDGNAEGMNELSRIQIRHLNARLHDEEIPNVDVFIKAYINEDVSEIDSKYHYIIDGSGDKEDTNQYIVTYKI